MKRSSGFFVVCGFFMISSAFAQFENIGKIRSKSDCNRQCNRGLPEVGKYAKELLNLQERHRDAKAKETDPERLKILEASEKKDLEKFQEKCEAACENICRYNPD